MNFEATQVINERARPRVLLLVGSNSIGFDWVESRAGTFRAVNDLAAVDLGEWDVLVTDERVVLDPNFGVPLRTFPDAMYTFRIIRQDGLVEFAKLGDEEGTSVRIRWQSGVPGHRMRRVSGLPEPLQELVQSQLVPSLENRKFQRGIKALPDDVQLEPTILDFRPFLVGPGGLIAAASYRRPNGSSHWVLPSDAGHLEDWFDCALTEWNAKAPSLFPNHASWQASVEWLTTEEKVVQDQIEAAKAVFEQQKVAYEARAISLDHELIAVRDVVGSARRTLLTGKDDDLQTAVLDALRKLGFEVEDMDLVWPADARREDFRIREDGSDWMVLADATGTANGAKVGKFSSLQNHLVSHLTLEGKSGGPTPGMWLIVNQLLHRDPNARGALFRDDEAEVIAVSNGLAIDTVALFLILEASVTDELKIRARAWMRGLSGQLTIDLARDWLGQQ